MRRSATAFAVLILCATPAVAGDWSITATPYLLLPNMDGKAALGPLETPVDASPSDIFKKLNWGVMGLFEVNNGQWGANVDITYMNLDATSDSRRASINGHQGAYTGTLLYRVHPNAEVYVGARVNDIGLKLEGTGPLGNPLTGSRGKTWVDPLIGVRTSLPIGGRTTFDMLVDYGGFGISSDHAVQVWPTFGFALNDRMKAIAGYRLLYTQYHSGASASRFEYDVLTFGPTVGLQFRF